MRLPHGAGSGRSVTTREARLVAKHGVRVPLRRVGRSETDPEYGWVTDYLTCGHVANGKPRKDGRYPCYTCQADEAERLEKGPQP